MLRLRMAIREAREHFILVGALVLLTVAAVAFNWSGNDYLKNLGPNLVAGFVGSALTIYGFDFILKRREERLRDPLKRAVYRDVRGVTREALGFWARPIDAPDFDRLSNAADWRAVFSPRRMLRIARHGQAKWHESLEALSPPSLEEARVQAAQTLERYSWFLEPGLISCLQRVASFDYLAYLATDIGKEEPCEINWKMAVLVMHAWTERTFEELMKRSGSVVPPPVRICDFISTSE